MHTSSLPADIYDLICSVSGKRQSPASLSQVSQQVFGLGFAPSEQNIFDQCRIELAGKGLPELISADNIARQRRSLM